MALSSATLPESAASPALTLAPAPQILAVKPGTSAASPLASVSPSIVTQKEWVVPPRPKPGRKPAMDTPPTKRKAQNRAAQRAFRERRAARVGELEEQLDEEKAEHDRKEKELRGRVARLEEEIRRGQVELDRWRLRCHTVEGMLEWERSEKAKVQEELKVLRFGSQSVGTEAVPLPPRRNNIQSREDPKPQQQQFQQTEGYPPELVMIDDPGMIGCQNNCTDPSSCACLEAISNSLNICGNCTPESCECAQEFMAMTTTGETDLKRPHSPLTVHTHPQDDHKRQRQLEPPTPLEIDFTAQFSRPSLPKEGTCFQDTSMSQPIMPARVDVRERCGFCEDGSFCACADMAQAQTQSSLLTHENRLPPLLHEVTPPPSDSDVTEPRGKLPVWQPKTMHRAFPLPVADPSKNSCASGPGTCEQCLSDPKSGQFCRSLAKLKEGNGAASSSPAATGVGCCGGGSGGRGGGCCMDKGTVHGIPSITSDVAIFSEANANATTTNPPPTLSCAQAYQTLSTHSAFERATESSEMGGWLGRLNATSVDAHTDPGAPSIPESGHVAQGSGTYEGRGPLEIEAASVMEVLKFFDRRFGRG